MANHSFWTTFTEVRVEREHIPSTSFGWAWLVVRGLIAIALGAVAILFPIGALFAFTMLFAAYVLVDGLASLVIGIGGARRNERWWALILRGLLGILVGALFVLMPVLSTIAYAVASLAIVSAWSILAGALELWAAIRLRKEMQGEWLLGLSGLLSIILGLAIPFILMMNPAATILSAAWIIGICAFAAGVVLIIQAIRLRRRKEADG